jgi:hypothetical protein
MVCENGKTAEREAAAMQSLVGTWKLIEARAFDEVGRELPLPFGPHPMGIVSFDTDRMVGVLGDARASLPPDAPPRFFVAYTGSYRFDGAELVTQTDDASRPELIVEQVRHVRFESPTRIVVVPVSGVPGLSIRSGIELVWQRLA